MPLRVDRRALVDLTPTDQVLFQRFGIGVSAAPPYNFVHHAFEDHAARRPDDVAIDHLGATITYGELDRQANRLAVRLAASGVSVGDHVGLFVQRSIPMVVGILAVLKAGAAYVPQDVRITPPAHLRHIIDTAATRVILTLGEFAQRIDAPPGHAIITIDDVARWQHTDIRPPRRVHLAADATAVVIFTSGTTGTPNGVAVTHRNLANVLLIAPGSLGIRPGMRVAQILNIAFDMAAWEILGALAHGATLVIRGCDIEATAGTVDVVIATPSILGGLDAERCRQVRVVAVAGERCPQSLADTWSEFAAFHNSCGPTEVTIVNTMQRYDRRRGALTIGRPMPNNTVYVLDDVLRPCPIGEVGEMWAGGTCVTAGYLANPDLNAERYRADPFLGGDHRMFRTRDLGRWTPDGELEHHGRTDDQVKLNGFRIELDAVTSAIELAPDCRQATTLLHDGSLVSFVTPATADTDAARRAVEQTLPYYYVPSSVVAVDELPVTGRGKVDKAALRALLASVADNTGARAAELVGAVA